MVAGWEVDRVHVRRLSRLPADHDRASTAGDKCNTDRDAAAAASKVKAQIFTHLLYRHWNHFTGDKRSHLFLVSVESGAMRDLNPNDTHDVPPFSLEGGGGFAISPDSKELAFTENLDPEPAISTNADIFTLDLTDPRAKPVKVSTSPGGDFNPAYSPDGKYLAWRSQARAGYESDKFRLVLYDRAAKTIKDLLPKFDNWVDEFVWSHGFAQHIYFVVGTRTARRLFQIGVRARHLSVRIRPAGRVDRHSCPAPAGPISLWRPAWLRHARKPVSVVRLRGVCSRFAKSKSAAQMSDKGDLACNGATLRRNYLSSRSPI